MRGGRVTLVRAAVVRTQGLHTGFCNDAALRSHDRINWGRRIPHIGGISIAKAESLESLQERMCADPFQLLGLVKTDIIPSEPASVLNALKHC